MFGQAHSQDEHEWAVNFCNEFVENNYKNWVEFFKFIADETNPEIVRFFFLQALTDIVKTKFDQSQVERAEKSQFIETAIGLLSHSPSAILSKTHFRSKYSQLLSLLYVTEGYMMPFKSGSISHVRLFNQYIQNLIVPSQEQPHFYLGFAHLLIDSI